MFLKETLAISVRHLSYALSLQLQDFNSFQTETEGFLSQTWSKYMKLPFFWTSLQFEREVISLKETSPTIYRA